MDAPMLFRGLIHGWLARRDHATWLTLSNGSLLHPLGYLHPAAWSPLCPTSRRHLVHPRQACAQSAHSLWTDLEARRGGMLVPLPYALEQAPLWQLVMCFTRRELLTLALWCGAAIVRRRVAAAVGRASAARWRGRLGERLYADVLRQPCELGHCRPLPPEQELTSGRLLLDLGLSMLAAWTNDVEGWARRRIEASAGPHHRPVVHYLGPEALQLADAMAAQPAVFAFVERQSHGS